MNRVAAWITSRYWVPSWAVLTSLLRLILVDRYGGAMRFGDETDYDRIAVAIASGKGFSIDDAPTGFRAPGQPLFLAAIYAVIGHDVLAAEAIQASLLSTIPFFVARFARCVDCGPVAANLAAALSSVHPALAYASATLYPTAITAVTLTIGVTLATEAIMNNSSKRGIAAGAVLGIAGMATTYLAVIPIFAGIVAAINRKHRVAIAVVVIGLLPACAWSARNQLALGTFNLATHGSYNLALGANDRASPRSGNWIKPDPIVCSSETECDRAYRDNAMIWIRSHPTQYAKLVLGRVIASVDSVGKPVTNGPHQNAAERLSGWLLLPWTLLGIAGLFPARRHPGTWLAGLSLLVIVATEALTIVKPRFRLPCDPLLAVFAIVAATALLRKQLPNSSATET